MSNVARKSDPVQRAQTVADWYAAIPEEKRPLPVRYYDKRERDECALVGAILMEPRSLPRVERRIAGGDFDYGPARTIYWGARKAFRRDRTIPVQEIVRALEEAGQKGPRLSLPRDQTIDLIDEMCRAYLDSNKRLDSLMLSVEVNARIRRAMQRFDKDLNPV